MRRFVLQEVVEASGRKVLCFIKLHAPWPVLCHYAEELNMRAPLQVSKSPFRPLYFSRLRCLSAGVKDMCARKCVFHPLYYIYANRAAVHSDNKGRNYRALLFTNRCECGYLCAPLLFSRPLCSLLHRIYLPHRVYFFLSLSEFFLMTWLLIS